MPPALPSLGGREPPAEVVAALKRLYPSVELLNIVADRWWLLNFSPSDGRRLRGEKMIEREWNRLKEGLSARESTLMVAGLLRDGWEYWGEYRWRGEAPRELLLADLRAKLGLTDGYMEAEMQRALDPERENEQSGARTREFLEAEGKSLHAITVRGRRHFDQGKAVQTP